MPQISQWRWFWHLTTSIQMTQALVVHEWTHSTNLRLVQNITSVPSVVNQRRGMCASLHKKNLPDFPKGRILQQCPCFRLVLLVCLFVAMKGMKWWPRIVVLSHTTACRFTTWTFTVCWITTTLWTPSVSTGNINARIWECGTAISKC